MPSTHFDPAPVGLGRPSAERCPTQDAGSGRAGGDPPNRSHRAASFAAAPMPFQTASNTVRVPAFCQPAPHSNPTNPKDSL